MLMRLLDWKGSLLHATIEAYTLFSHSRLIGEPDVTTKFIGTHGMHDNRVNSY